MAINLTNPGSLTFDSISQNLPNVLNGLEDDINSLTSKTDPTASDLFKMQQAVTEWSLASSTYSTILKTLGDTLKSTLQKIN